MPAIEHNHHSTAVSIKLKIVIFLVFFGLFMIAVDFVGDRKPVKKKFKKPTVFIEEKHAKKKNKKKKNN